MGLSSFNAMRARRLAEQNALKKAESAPLDVKPADAVEVSPSADSAVADATAEKPKRKTDAEKLKKKKEQ